MKVLLTHYDLDGLSCIILAKYFKIDYDGMDIIDYETFENNPERFYSYKEIHFTDISPPKELYDDLKSKGIVIYIFDHHERGLIYEKEENCFIDLNYAGTKIYFNWLSEGKRIPSVLSHYVHLVDTYDMWRKTHEDWEEAQNLNRVLRSKTLHGINGIKKYEGFILSQLNKIDRAKRDYYFTDVEKSKISDHVYKETTALDKARKILQVREDERGFKFGLFMARAKISQSCTRLLEENSDFSYIVCINTYNGIDGKISVRSPEEFDCN